MGSDVDVDVRAIARDIFATVLGLELVEVPDAPGDGVVVTGCVHLSGAWEGSVTVECAEALAVRATAAMFLMAPDEVTEEELRDVVGELANMTGGNVKSAIGGDVRMSLPSVTRGHNARISVPGTVPADRVAFDCDGHRLVVTRLARAVAGATTPTDPTTSGSTHP